ncbi:acyltransferase [Nocardioides sp. ChNu-153]|uniref:acyltransferase family protein n=1 Tax=Nocardioides sp. ChNu-153 TaxID=2779364 RepID=UPI00264D7D19|nr:acyltransferase [Nocardioides sp. ChNu-153]MDN7120319.1 acyltransferase [Nocardioides sp. ChNu-153]
MTVAPHARDLSSATKTHRLASLDGLRGAASIAVMLHHAALLVPAIAVLHFDRAATAPASVAWFTTTPLHALWDGNAAVYVFFVLSGYVLVWQVLRAGPDRYDWAAYYPSRIVRLYVPVWAALVLALAVTWALSPFDGNATSEWLQRRTHDPSLGVLVDDAVLLVDPGHFVTPLWSLQWEVWFSLLLPLFVLLARPARPPRWLWVGGAAALAGVMVLTVGGERYMVMFLLGALLASNAERLGALADALNERRALSASVWLAAAVVVAVTLPARWTLPGLTGRSSDTLELAAATGGATLLVLAALYCPALRWALSTRPLTWLGMVSFSLYLVHEPILVALARALGDDLLWFAIPLGLAVSLVAALAFYRLVERPAHNGSKAVRRRVARKTAPRGSRAG